MKTKTRLCKICRTRFEVKSNTHWYCDFDCAMEGLKKEKEKKAKSIQRNKRTTHSHLYIKENKADLQTTINHIARLIDKDCRCIDCDRTEAKPCWDGGHFKSRGSTPSLRYNLHNIFKQTRYCNSKSEGNKEDYDKGLKDMYGEDYYVYVVSLEKKYNVLHLPHNEIPEALKSARKILRELKKLDQSYTPEHRIRLRTEYNKRIGIYKKD